MELVARCDPSCQAEPAAACGFCFSSASSAPQVPFQKIPKAPEKLSSCPQTPISGLVGSLGARRKRRIYDMGCDCGKRKETPAEKAACQESARLEAPDQVHISFMMIRSRDIQETVDSETMKRIKRRRGMTLE